MKNDVNRSDAKGQYEDVEHLPPDVAENNKVVTRKRDGRMYGVIFRFWFKIAKFQASAW